MALLLLIGLTFPAYAGVTVFDSDQAGNKVLSPRGYSVTASVDGEEKELWLQSPFDHAYYDGINNNATVTQGSSDDSLEVESLDAGNYTFHLWIDKNPAGGNLSGDINQYFAVYINDEDTPEKLKELSGTPYNIVFGDVNRNRKDPNGLEDQWSIEFSMNVLEGESYRFVFLRGIQANNGNTTVLFDSVADGKKGSIGYVNGKSVTAEETAAYEKAKFDVYEYVSGKTELGKDADNYTVYALTLVPFEHALRVNGGTEPEPPVHVHTETVLPAKPVTCTETGLTEGKKCSVCGEELVKQEVIPAKGHTEVVLPAKAATCTDTGLTEGKKCSVCDEVLVKQETVKALGHDFKDGKCTRCDAEDPDYVKPVDPTPVDPTPVAKLNGLTKGKDDKWAMYDNDKVVTSYTGLAKSPYNGNWYYLKNGYIDWNYTGFGQNLTTKKWYRVKDGRVDWTANSIYKKPETGAWYKCYEGRVTFKENGVFKNDYGWWKVKNSKVDFNFTGIASNKNGTWYIKNGCVDFNKNGKVTFNGKTYNVNNGRAKLA